jgi:hypothetical protein
MKKPEDILNTWIITVNSGDIKNLLSLYNENAALIPTFSNKILDTPQKICEYFEKLGSREKLSVSLHEKTIHKQKISDSIYTLSGVYLWQFVSDEELLGFEARFSYVFDVTLASPIIHHHSSQIPRML